MQHETLRRHDARYAREVLKSCGGHKGMACAVLNITYPTLKLLLDEARELPQVTPEEPAA